MQEIELEHEWSHQKQTVRVERITVTTVTIRFPIIGSCYYDLNLEKNTMRATSPAVRRKHPFCLWRAADIESVRRMVWVHMHPEDEAVKKSFERHTENMPLRKV